MSLTFRANIRSLFYGLSIPALIAAPCVHAGAVVTPTTITQFGVYSGSSGATGAFIYFSPAIAVPPGCTYGNELWIDFSSTVEPTGKSLYATFMAAWLAGHAVSFEISGCAPNGAPLVYEVQVTP